MTVGQGVETACGLQHSSARPGLCPLLPLSFQLCKLQMTDANAKMFIYRHASEFHLGRFS